jgi:hypothetical protein
MWIKSSIVIVVKEGEPIEKDVVHLSMPPTFEAKSYRTTWAFGNHLLSNVEGHLTTCDNGVTSIFEQECVLGPIDQRQVFAKLEY